MADIEHKRVDAKIESLEKRLYKQYAQAYKELRQKYNDYMANFEDQRIKMKKRVSKGEISKKEYKDWLTSKSLNSKWYRDMSNVMAKDIHRVNEIAASTINGELPEVYADNFNFGTYSVEKASRVNTSFTLYSKETVVNLARNDARLLPNVKIDKTKDIIWNRQKFNGAIAQSVLQGESLPEAAKRLRKVVGMDYNSSVRSARTALTSAQNKGRIDSFSRAERKFDIKGKKVWIATLDKHTRSTHRELDGEEIDLKDTFWNGLEYPGDPDGEPAEVYNCRCTLGYDLFDDDFSDVSKRFSRLEDVSYDEWKKGRN